MTEVLDSLPALRLVQQNDASAVLAAFRSNPDMARQGNISSMTTAEGYVAHLRHPQGPHSAFAVVDGGGLVGLVAVTVNRESRTGWFWYWMHQDRRGLGWTSRAAATVANWALSSAGVERLELGHRANNPGSARVAIAAGFVQEGRERQKFLIDGERIDVLNYGRLPSDPVPGTAELVLRLS